MDRYEWSGTGEEKIREFGSRLPEGSRENEKRNTEMAGIHCVDHINNDNGDSNNDGNRKKRNNNNYFSYHYSRFR